MRQFTKGFSLLEIMLVLAILGLASGIVLYTYTPGKLKQQTSSVTNLLFKTRDQSFYQQATLRLVCDKNSLQQQLYSPSITALPPSFGQPPGQWQNTELALKLESTLCLQKTTQDNCTPCPGEMNAGNNFAINFSDGLAAQTYRLIINESKGDEGLGHEDDVERETQWLDISANGLVTVSELVP